MNLICMKQNVHILNLMTIDIGDGVMMDGRDVLDKGVIILLLIIIVCLPLVCTIVLGTYLATLLGLTGIAWWGFIILCFVILFLCIAMV